MSKYAERQARTVQLQHEARHALETGDLDLVKKHLKAGRYDIANSRYDSMVLTRVNHFGSAAAHGQIHIMDFFFELEPTASVDHKGGYLLSQAANRNQVPMLNYLMEKGANQYSKDNALVNAAWNGSTEAIKCLLDNNAKVGYDDQHAMKVAAIGEYCDSLKLLVEHGANLNNDNDSIFLFCVKEHKNEIVKTMIVDLNMEIKPETQKWLEDNDHTDTLQLISKRELNKKLSQNLGPKPKQKIKGPTMKI